jgi:hypothetical protein
VTGRSKSVKRTAEVVGFHLLPMGRRKNPRLANRNRRLAKDFEAPIAKVLGLGVYHGLRGKHLQSYLYEFVFPFNSRRTRHGAFRSLLGIFTGH